MASDLEWFENPAPLPTFIAGTTDEKPTGLGPSSNGTGGGEDERPAKRRRNRVKMSCRACQSRKLRCDKQPSQESCDGCIKRKQECTWDPPVVTSKIPEDVQRELDFIRQRLVQLEAQMATKQDRPGIETFPPPLPPALHAASTVRPTTESPASTSHLSQPRSPAPPVPDSETEDAAAALEEIALGRRQYGGYGGLNLETPMSKGQPSHPTVPAGSWTSILLAPQPPSFSEQRTTRERENASLLGHLPPNESVSEALVELFMSNIAWNYSILHKPTFLAECRQLWSLVRSGTTTTQIIDPAWLSCYFFVLCWACSSITPDLTPSALSIYSATELARLPRQWNLAATRGLELASWASKPQLRCAQAILLKISYQRPSSQTMDNEEGGEGTSFFVWLSAAIRVCQLLGLHRLGKDPQTMPVEDPGLPREKCLMRREVAKRVWAFCLSHDYMFCHSANMGQIFPESFDTEPPLNLDEADLGLTMEVPRYSPNYMTDYSYSKLLFVVAQYQLLATQLAQHRESAGYATIVQLNTGLQAEIAQWEAFTDCSNPNLKPYHRALLLTVLHHRILRLHRPFFMRGINPTTEEDKRYELSVSESIKSAAAVCRGLDEVSQTKPLLEHLWFLGGYGLSSVIVLFMSLLQKEERGLDSTWERDLILLVRQFYARNPKASIPKSVSHQACLIIDQLLSSKRVGSAAALFRSTAIKMMTPASAGETSSALTAMASGDYSMGYSTAGTPGGYQPEPSSLPAFPSLNLHLTLSRAYPSLPSSRVHSPEPMSTEHDGGEGGEASNSGGGGEEDTFDVTASRYALSSLAQNEVSGMGTLGMSGHTDWSEILRGMNDAGASVLVDGGW